MEDESCKDGYRERGNREKKSKGKFAIKFVRSVS